MSRPFDPQHVNITGFDPKDRVQFICALLDLENGNENEDEKIITRVIAAVVILAVSTLAVLSPLCLKMWGKYRLAREFYEATLYIGAGVIIGTVFSHLLDSAYQEIGPQSCVGMTGGWEGYPWPPAIMLVSLLGLFILDFTVKQWSERKSGIPNRPSIAAVLTRPDPSAAVLPQHNTPLTSREPSQYSINKEQEEQDDEGGDQEIAPPNPSFTQEITTFLILEFGVVFHSIIIGLNLGTTSTEELTSLWIVICFHQTFEGLGIGARLSAIEFPKNKRWMKWVLCALYGLTTPIAIFAGVGLRKNYDAGSFEARVISGVLDSISAGILLYTGLVEMLAKDFLFNLKLKLMRKRKVALRVVYVLLGTGLMVLLAKWA